MKMLDAHEVNIVQMPCPEMLGEGLVRRARDITYYRNSDFEELCGKLAYQVAALMEQFVEAEYIITALVGVERSPSCSLSHVKEEGKIIEGKGVFMQHLIQELPPRLHDVFTLSMDHRRLETTLETLRARLLGFE